MSCIPSIQGLLRALERMSPDCSGNQTVSYQRPKRLPPVVSVALVLLALAFAFSGQVAAAQSCEIEGDLDGDCDVDFNDLSIFGQSWMTYPWDDGWRPLNLVKFSNDLRIDAEDLALMSGSWLVGTYEPASIVSEVRITPAGGYFDLPGGIAIDAPQGAVDEEVSFTIRLLAAAEVEPYLDIGELTRTFMGGVEIDSNGVAFNMPITIELPVESLKGSSSLPYPYYLNRQDGTLVPDMPVSGQVQGSYAVLAEGSDGISYQYDGRDVIIQFLRDVFPPGLHTTVFNEVYDVLGHSDCTVNPCRCLGIRSLEAASDYSSSMGCSNATISGKVEFFYCQGSPTEGWQMQEQSIQIAVKTTPDKRSVRCNESLTLAASVHGLDGRKLQGFTITATSSRPDILAVTSFGSGLFLLEQVGSNSGTANVIIETDCNVKRTVPIEVGCEIPDVTGPWTVGASERWRDCQLPEDNGIYADTFTVEIDSQIGTSFAASWELVEFEDDYTLHYEEHIFGQITADCMVKDRCEYKVKGNTVYTETYTFLDDEEPYTVEGRDTFEGTYTNGVIRLSTAGRDISGDTCVTKGGMVLWR